MFTDSKTLGVNTRAYSSKCGTKWKFHSAFYSANKKKHKSSVIESQLYETGCSEIFFFFCLYTQTKGQVHQSQQQTVVIGNVLLNFPKTELTPSSHLTHSQWFLFLAKNKTQKVEVLNDIKEVFFGGGDPKLPHLWGKTILMLPYLEDNRFEHVAKNIGRILNLSTFLCWPCDLPILKTYLILSLPSIPYCLQ